MHRRKFFVGLTAAVLAAVPIMSAGPAHAALSNACNEGMAPAAEGNASGLEVACTFTSTGISSNILINDYPTAVWHSGAARQVNVNDATVGSATITSTPAAGQVGITAADINHSIEGLGIAPGTFIIGVTGTTVTLSKKTVAGGATVRTVLIANSTARAVSDGKTTAASGTVTSATAHFVPADVGKRLITGSIPDGATIATVPNATTVTLACTGCVPAGFGSVTAGSALPLTIEPVSAATTMRFVTDALFTASNTITSPSAKFGSSDIGLAVTGVGVPAGTHITATASGGGSATVTPATLPVSAATKHNIVVGVANKTAPVNVDVVGQLAIELTVSPVLSPTSPPCAAKKVSTFQIPIQWQNPGTYDTAVTATDFSGSVLPPMSTAQLLFKTSAASFAGFLVPVVSVTGTTATTTGYQVSYPFLPVGVGVCTGTGLAAAWQFNGISMSQAKNPTNTGPPGESVRSLKPMPQGTSVNYTGAAGATRGALVTTKAPAGNQPTNTNACALSSPIVLGWQCGH